MKRVLVLGAGMVAKPFVEEMLSQGFKTTCIDVDKGRAQSMIGDHPLGTALSLDIRDEKILDEQIENHDLVGSLLPPPFHPMVARRCLAKKTNMVTTSYLSEEMKAMADDAEKAGLLFLNETGLDPGIDHMTAMDLRDEIHAAGGKVIGFQSHCGGFPAPSAANNPIRYKFSWNPSGVLGALSRPSSFMADGSIVNVPGEDMLAHSVPILIEGEGLFETTPNGNGPYYAEKYGLHDCSSVRRGTLRYPGWARFWTFAGNMGWLDRDKKVDVTNASPIEVFQMLSGSEHTDFIHEVTKKNPGMASHVLEILHSLGFFEDRDLTGSYSAFDVFLEQTQKHWQYIGDEVDKVILYNRFEVISKEGEAQIWTSLLSQEGVPGSHSAMSTLVGLPCAIAGTQMLKGEIPSKGVKIPLAPEIYQPILRGLISKGVRFVKSVQPKKL